MQVGRKSPKVLVHSLKRKLQESVVLGLCDAARWLAVEGRGARGVALKHLHLVEGEAPSLHPLMEHCEKSALLRTALWLVVGFRKEWA